MKKKILFFASNLMYYKSLLPYIFFFIKKKQKVFLRVSSKKLIPNFIFNFYKILRPQAVDLITKDTILHLAKIYNLEKDYKRYKEKINFMPIYLNKFQLKLNTNLSQFDKIVITTKDLDYLKIFNDKSKFYAVGYPPIPIFLDLNKNYKKYRNLFKSVKKFSLEHKFEDIIKSRRYNLRNFSYIAKKRKRINKKDSVIIYHPGGYRNVFTKPNENKNNCYKIQKKIFQDLCLPILKQNIKLLIKVHPWHARYHGERDMVKILKKIGINNKVKVIKANQPYDYALEKAKFVIMFGSTSAYELWAKGFKNIFFINYYGKKRSKKFSFFKKNFFNKKSDFENAIKTKNINKYFCKEYLRTFNFFNNLKNKINFDSSYIIKD